MYVNYNRDNSTVTTSRGKGKRQQIGRNKNQRKEKGRRDTKKSQRRGLGISIKREI